MEMDLNDAEMITAIYTRHRGARSPGPIPRTALTRCRAFRDARPSGVIRPLWRGGLEHTTPIDRLCGFRQLTNHEPVMPDTHSVSTTESQSMLPSYITRLPPDK